MSGINLAGMGFDWLKFCMTEEELDLKITFIAVHATPWPGRPYGGKGVLKWRLVCIHFPLDVRREMRAVSFEVNPMVCLVPGITVSRVFLRDESFINWENDIDGNNYWWHKDALETNGAAPTFRDIIRFLEKADNRCEALVDPNTFKGSYDWICTMIWLLEESRYLTGTSYKIPGEQPGTTQVLKTTAFQEFLTESMAWVGAMGLNDCI